MPRCASCSMRAGATPAREARVDASMRSSVGIEEV
jgi:hypothetical protein